MKLKLNPIETVPENDADDIFIIDRESMKVRRSDDPDFEATILQTQCGSLRDDEGRKIGVEVFHRCETPDGHIFVLDDSALFLDGND